MTNDAPNWGVLLSALPAIVGTLRLVWPSGQRGLASSLERLSTVAKDMPEGVDKSGLMTTIGRLSAELAYREERRRRRSPDGAAIAAVIFLLALAVGGSWTLLAVDHWIAKAAGGVLAFIATLVAFAGADRVNPVHGQLSFERRKSTE